MNPVKQGLLPIMQPFSNFRAWLLALAVTIILLMLGINGIVNSNSTSEPIPPNPSSVPDLRTIGAVVQRKSDKHILKDVEVMVYISGSPKLTRTGSTGYFEIEIPSQTKKVTIELRKEGYYNESYPFNLEVDRDITDILFMEQI